MNRHERRAAASPALFTVQHYEYLTERLRHVPQPAKKIVVEILCWIFQQDNPKFKRELFITQATEE
jgi:hypothetical protein